MTTSFPDIANSTARFGSKLQRVGMNNIEVPVRIAVPGQRGDMLAMARAAAYVSLDDTSARGIHMSRLYLSLQTQLESQPLSFLCLEQILQEFLLSHAQISQSAYVTIEYDQPMKRRALKTNNLGWRSYPIKMEAKLSEAGFETKLTLRVAYSSTCPCSAALSRQITRSKLEQKFEGQANVSLNEVSEWLGTEEGIGATPHGQRSEVTVVLIPQAPLAVDLESLIDVIEDALQTPVQAAVKREDEQEFAVRNGTNLMFAEDAARRVKDALTRRKDIKDFELECVHFESLHAHNAVASAVKDY